MRKMLSEPQRVKRAAGVAFPIRLMSIKRLQIMAITMLGILSVTAFAEGDSERGNELFQQYCRGCHGPDGRGGRASGFMPRPQNLTKKGYIDKLPDDYLFFVISKGGAGVGKSEYMPAFETTFSQDDIHNVIAFIRTLSTY